MSQRENPFGSMQKGVRRLLGSLERVFARPEMPAVQRRQRASIGLGLAIITPALGVICILDWIAGRHDEAWRMTALVSLLALTLMLLPRWPRPLDIMRFILLLTMSLMALEMAVGANDGTTFVWFFVLPLGIFYLMGEREGALWILAIWVLAAWLFFGRFGSLIYEPSQGVLFMIIYGVLALLGHGLEATRRRVHERLEADKAALEATLADARALSGLLPICAECKRIRDDRGFWSQIETYLDQHSAIELQHALCPDCGSGASTRPEPGS